MSRRLTDARKTTIERVNTLETNLAGLVRELNALLETKSNEINTLNESVNALKSDLVTLEARLNQGIYQNKSFLSRLLGK